MRSARSTTISALVLVTALAAPLLGAVPSTHAGAPPPRTAPSPTPSGDWVTFAELAFDTPVATFMLVATDAGHPRHAPRLNWSTDLCSAPLLGNTGRSYDFSASCRRHDFGYRNLHLLESRWGWGNRYWNPDNRAKVDRQFLVDMLGHCATRSWWLRWSCRRWAWVYFLAVRTAGGLH